MALLWLLHSVKYFAVPHSGKEWSSFVAPMDIRASDALVSMLPSPQAHAQLAVVAQQCAGVGMYVLQP